MTSWTKFSANLTLVVLPAVALAQTKAHQQPNIVFILSDDQRWDCVGVAGNPSIQTPEIDKLAREGVYFQQATVTTPQCSPCRAQLLTGLPPHQNGWYSNYSHRRDVGKPRGFEQYATVPGELSKAGYVTALVGKWHLKPDPWLCGFTQVRTWLPAGMGKYKDLPLSHGNTRETSPTSGFTQEIFGDDAVDFIREQSSTKPFFLWLALTAPHTPLKPNPPRDDKPYTGKTNQELAPPTFKAPTEEDRLTSFTVWPNRKKKQKPAGKQDQQRETDWHHYYAAITSADEQLGKVRKALRDKHLDQNTIIVFLGDNGLMRGSRGWSGKVLPYEESLRVPMIVYAPEESKIKGPSNAQVTSLDLSASFLQWAGVKVPVKWAGRDITAALQEKMPGNFEAMVCEFADNVSEKFGNVEYRVVRTPTSKLIVWRDPAKGEEFFDLKKDPRELHNLVADQAKKDEIQHLKSILKEWKARTDDDSWTTSTGMITGNEGGE